MAGPPLDSVSATTVLTSAKEVLLSRSHRRTKTPRKHQRETQTHPTTPMTLPPLFVHLALADCYTGTSSFVYVLLSSLTLTRTSRITASATVMYYEVSTI
ncbi:hypothetical protein OH77DRAFT_532767 [Trametes cingulata]|nr:hypothetical protein OH77DRAFT_532767 [Trametes cingulata]